ncbi:sulfate adenylyltransferase subunit 2, partial [Erythrobacter sanguineus]
MRSLTHLERLEAESIHIFREVVAEAENPVMRSVRFRTRGCYPLTGATQSDAADMNTIIQEMLLATSSERQG